MSFSLLSRTAAAAAMACALAGCGSGSKTDAVGAADGFFGEVAKGDLHGAYDGTAFAFQAGQSYEGFQSNVTDLGLVGAQPPAWETRMVNGTAAQLSGKVPTKSGAPLNVTLSMANERGTWKVLTLRTSDAQHYWQPENRFTMVGKGVGFNDVYHQPMPGPEELQGLAHETLSDFNDAVKAADFHRFYRSVSDHWREKTPEEGGGVTEKMLKDHFQGFIDLKIDLAPALALKAVFDGVPMINEDGLLVMNGHIDTPQYKVSFHFEYIYEMPKWKLYGIDVTLTN